MHAHICNDKAWLFNPTWTMVLNVVEEMPTSRLEGCRVADCAASRRQQLSFRLVDVMVVFQVVNL